MNNVNNIIVLYHANCTDGFGAAYAAWKIFGSTAEYHPMSYGDTIPDVTDKHVYMVDWSCKRDVIETMHLKALSITILDHHKTAQADIEPLMESGTVDGVFDMSKSGAVIAWEWFHEETAPLLLQHIQDYDLWQFKMSGTREVISALRSYKMTFELWDELCRDEEAVDRLKDDGKAILRNHINNVKQLGSNARTLRLCGFEVPCVNANGFMASDLGNLLCKDKPFAATYFINKQGEKIFSLRSSKDGEDVSKIAALMGGGGHRNAAGFHTYDQMKFV